MGPRDAETRPPPIEGDLLPDLFPRATAGGYHQRPVRAAIGQPGSAGSRGNRSGDQRRGQRELPVLDDHHRTPAEGGAARYDLAVDIVSGRTEISSRAPESTAFRGQIGRGTG